jgi:hypothetical protein
MFKRLINRIKLYFRPPNKGDVFYANPIYFVVGKPFESVLHGLRDKSGEPVLFPVPSDSCYKLTVESCVMDTYYRCTSEVFCRGLQMEKNIGVWMKRTQPKRFGKAYFRQLVIDGYLWKE